MPLQTWLWHLVGEELAKIEVAGARWLAPGKGEPVGDRREGAMTVMAIAAVGQTVAVALVPDERGAAMSCNGLLLAAGLHQLRHGDRLEVDERPFWVSVEATHDEADYDPARHGADVFCFITKARLSKSDPITICPGTPGKSCGVIYTRGAWAMALQSPKPFKCPSCGYDPQQSGWKPAWEKPRNTLAELLEIVARRSLET